MANPQVLKLLNSPCFLALPEGDQLSEWGKIDAEIPKCGMAPRRPQALASKGPNCSEALDKLVPGQARRLMAADDYAVDVPQVLVDEVSSKILAGLGSTELAMGSEEMTRFMDAYLGEIELVGGKQAIDVIIKFADEREADGIISRAKNETGSADAATKTKSLTADESVAGRKSSGESSGNLFSRKQSDSAFFSQLVAERKNTDLVRFTCCWERGHPRCSGQDRGPREYNGRPVD